MERKITKPMLTNRLFIYSNMDLVKKQKLEIRLNFIFNFDTQQELAEKLNINQWKLLEKMKDNSFTNDEVLLIEKICNELKN
jgi:hypothetical protein